MNEMTLNKAMKIRSVQLGLTVTQLQKITGIHYSTISKFFRGKRTINSNKVQALLEALDFDIISELNKVED